ncbi:MAG TPA: N-acetyltransferase [Candidatus Faecousia intestinigallinarum]|nr:N-acetyltransferase [Candidatus Faecousia intestinigallinarum]
MEQWIIRPEVPGDYAPVEALTRRAFWNLYTPGCYEHYLVHIMRRHPDFLPELAFVAELRGEIVGSILYTRAKLTDEQGEEREILTFGPISVAPEYQRQGIGKALMEHSFAKAREMGYDAVVIFGAPANYVGRGFRSCRRYNVTAEGGIFPAAMLVKELRPGTLDGRRWVYAGSSVMELDMEAAAAYTAGLEPWEEKVLPSQEEFYILSHSVLSES